MRINRQVTICLFLLMNIGVAQAQFTFNDLLTGFNKNLFFTDVQDAKIMYKDGRVIENVKTFYHPVIISSPALNLGEWSLLVDKEGYKEKSISKNDLKAIYIDGNTWVLRNDPVQGDSWVVITHWGAIERGLSFNYSENLKLKIFEEKLARELAKGMGAAYDKKDIQFAPAKRFQKLKNDPTYGSQMKVSFRKEMGEMTADYPELSAKIESKAKGYRVFDLEGIIKEYNEWYDKQNPGKITVITDEDWGIEEVEPMSMDEIKETLNSMAKMKNAKAAAKAKYEAKEASRPATPPASIAEVKPNVPVKKETFTQKIARIKSDGNKVGVQFMNPYVYIKPPVSASSSSSGGMGGFSGGMLSGTKSGSKHPTDTINAYPELKELALSFVKDMNTAFDTDVFELVEDINQVPLKKVMGSYLIDDWWATKYKLLMIYQIDSYYDISKTSNKYSGNFRATSHLTATEFFLKGDKPQQKVIVATAAMGHYNKTLEESADDSIQTIEDIQSGMDGIVEGHELYETLLAERKPSFDKFVAKKKKK